MQAATDRNEGDGRVFRRAWPLADVMVAGALSAALVAAPVLVRTSSTEAASAGWVPAAAVVDSPEPLVLAAAFERAPGGMPAVPAPSVPSGPAPVPAPPATPAIPVPVAPDPPAAPPIGVPAGPEPEKTVDPPPPALPSPLEIARSEVGGPEARYTTGWGFAPGFWCAKFISWVLAHAGVALREDGPGDFRAGAERVDVPAPGDLVFIDLMPQLGTGQVSHVGIVEAVNPDGSVATIEGNADDSGLVTRQVRGGAEIVGYGRLPAPTSSTVIPAPPSSVETGCVWIEIGKPWLCDWTPKA